MVIPVYVKNLGTVTEGPDFRRGALDKAGVPATGGGSDDALWR